jgi:hypothetical protein
MFPLEYDRLVREYQRVDLLREAAQKRLTSHASLIRTWYVVREAALRVACRLSLPALGPVCVARPA